MHHIQTVLFFHRIVLISAKMNCLFLVGLLAALAVSSATPGFLSGGYSGGNFGGSYNGGLLSTGSSLSSAPVATSSITQQRIIHSVPIPTRIISTPTVASGSYYNGVQGGYGGHFGGSNGGNLGSGTGGNFGSSSGINSINSGSNGYGNAGGNYGGYGRNGY